MDMAASRTIASSSFRRTESSSRPGDSTARRRASSIPRTASRSIPAGRLFVADRVNSRVQIFDADGNFVAEWKQFGRPSGIFIDKNDIAYVTDNQSSDKRNPGFKQGIRIGSVKDGKVTALVPPDATLGVPEMLTVDDQGTIYAGFTGDKWTLRKFAKQ